MNQEIWSCYLESLRNQIKPGFRVYLEGMTCRNMDAAHWEIALPDRSSLAFVESQLGSTMKSVLQSTLKRFEIAGNADITFTLSGSETFMRNGVLPLRTNVVKLNDVSSYEERRASFSTLPASTSAFHYNDDYSEDNDTIDPFETAGELREMSHLNNRYTFDNFIVGGSNECAICAAKAVATKPADAYNPLFIYGGVGLGKTHLIHAIGNELLDTLSLRVRYMTSEEFTNECIQCMSVGPQKMNEFRVKMRDELDVLLLDDIQFIANKERTQEEFFNTFNYLMSNHKQIVLTSDRPPQELRDIDDRMRSRFCINGWFDIQLPDFETRLAIIHSKASVEGIFLPRDVEQYIATKVATNVRELEGCIKRIKNAAAAHGESISLSLAQRLIDPFYQKPQVLLNVEAIISCVCTYFGISRDELMSACRKKEISYPRKVAMYLARTHTSLSLPAIGSAFERDHTTVMSAVRGIKKDLENDSELQLNVKMIEKKLFDR